MKASKFSFVLLLLVPLAILSARTLTEREYLEIRREIANSGVYAKVPRVVFEDNYTEAWAPHFRKEVEKGLNAIFRRAGVSYKDFDEAHERFSRLGLPYSLELRMYTDTAGKYALGAWDKVIMPYEDMDIYHELSADIGAKSDLLIEMDSSGNAKLFNIPQTYEEIRVETGKFIKEEWPGEVHLRCSGKVLSARVFELMTGMPEIAMLNVSPDFSFRKYMPCHISTDRTRLEYLNRWNARQKEIEDSKRRKSRMPRGYGDDVSLPPRNPRDTLPDFMFPGIKGIAKIEGSGALTFNSEPVASIDDLIEASRAEHRGVQMVAVDEDVSWGQVCDLLKAVDENRLIHERPPITIRSSVLSIP